ncbi:MAG: PEGA domain-containing protein [Candidatus Marinimicrobia bacterium]|nr:PEGA domain-containing protein [Candidatus Neomarinimicrobiota bacterium]
MEKIKPYLILFLFIVTQLIGQKSVIAVADVKSDGLSEFEIKQLFNRIESDLVNLGQYQVTSRSEAEQILNEVKFQQSGCTDQQCAAEIGKWLNADYMLLPNVLFDKNSGDINVTLKLVDVETARITTSISKDDTVNRVRDINTKLFDYLVELYRKDTGEVSNGFVQQRLEKGVGSLKIETNPIGATVIFDNRQHGVTPLQVDDVEEGHHAIILSYEGYERLQKGVVIVADSVITISEVLTKRKGHLQIITEPIGCEVYLDDEYKGNSPLNLQYLDLGSYFLKISHEGFQEEVSKISVQWNKTEIIKRNLSAEPASVAFYSVPKGATVYVDGKSVGKTTNAGLVVNIPDGQHNIQMKLKGYSPVSKTASLSPGDNTSIELQLIKLPDGVSENPNVGWVSVNGWPEDCNVSLAGELLSLPIKYFELHNGRYSLKATKDGYLNQNVSFNVKAQKLTETQFQLKPVDREKSKTRAWLFPGLGHYYAEKPAKGLMWTALEIASLYGAYYFYNDYQNKLSTYDNAHSNYLNSSTHDEIESNKVLYQDAYDKKNISLASLGTMSGIAITVWIWNVFDLNNSIPYVLPFPKGSQFEIGVNEKGELETQIKF